MPARPRGEDILMYNAWALAHGRPRWGAPEAPAPLPKAAPTRHGRPGLPLPAPPAHGQMPVEEEHGGGWRRGTYWVNRTEYARLSNGQVCKLRTFNSRTGAYKWFPSGRDYYSHNRQEFIINVPCLAYIPQEKTRGEVNGFISLFGLPTSTDNTAATSVDVDGDERDLPLLRSTYYGSGHTSRIVPLTPDGIKELVDAPQALHRLSALGRVRDEDYSQNDIEDALRRNVPLLLANLPRVNTVDGMKHKVSVNLHWFGYGTSHSH